MLKETKMIYVLSDIHGNSERFNSIMEQINLQPEDTLYVLGDVVDRYPDGIKILKKLMKTSHTLSLIPLCLMVILILHISA